MHVPISFSNLKEQAYYNIDWIQRYEKVIYPEDSALILQNEYVYKLI